MLLNRSKIFFGNVLRPVPVWLLCFVAISPSLGTAVAAIGRLVLYLFALVLLPLGLKGIPQGRKPITVLVLIACAYMALSVLWSDVDATRALLAWSRHARLLTIPVLYYVIASQSQARTVLKAYTYAQVFVVLTSWLLVLGVRAPWVTALHADDTYAVFGSYLEQSISQGVLMALLWYQRDSIFGPRGRYLAIALSCATLVLTLGFLPGRSGYMVALGLITLAVIHEIPKRYKWTAVLVPFLALAIVGATSSHFRARMMQVSTEIAGFTSKTNTDTSSGERLLYWQISGIAIAEKPVFGFGAGSWNHEYRRLENGRAIRGSLSVDNPHQLFLLWTVDGGVIGLALLCAVLASLWWYSRRLPVPDQLSLQAMIAALVISGMFNSMIYGIGMGDFFCIGLGLLAALNAKESQNA